jgi:hypothetical protein
MIGFYSIRKLIEAKKLSSSTIENEIVVCMYPSKGKPITLINWHSLDRLFDLKNRQQKALKLLTLCHQFVHSYVFTPVQTEEGRLHSILFCSDHARKSALYEVELEQIVGLFEKVGTDYPDRVFLRFDANVGDYEVTAHNTNDPIFEP